MRREETREGRHEVGAAVVVDGRSQGLDLLGVGDEAEVVAQPLHERPRDGDGALERIDRRGVVQLVADRREQPVGRVDDLGAGVEEHEVAGAVGVLRGADLEAGLPEGRRLLVTEDARDRHVDEDARLARAVDLRRRADLRQHRERHAHLGGDLLVPGEGAQVHEEGPRGVGDVGDVDAVVVGTAGEVPEQPAVDGAAEQLPGLGTRSRAVDVVEDPAHLGAGEVGRERQAGDGLEALRPDVAGELVADRLRAGVLPDDGVVDRLAGRPLPHDGGLALVGDADRDDVRRVEVGLAEGAADDRSRVLPDLEGVVLDPARAREDLPVLELVDGHHPPAAVEDHGASARRALVDRDDVAAVRCRHVPNLPPSAVVRVEPSARRLEGAA